MKALIVMKDAGCDWLREKIPNQHPGMMPLCNKPLLEYMLDFAVLCGCNTVRFVMDNTDAKMENYFGIGSRWGVDISYASARATDELGATLKKNSGFTGDDALLIVDGFIFIHHNKGEEYRSIGSRSGEGGALLSCSSGQVLLQQPGETPQVLTAPPGVTLAVSPLESIRDIHALSMQVLSRDAANYVLPGYNNEEGVFIGRNVAISKTTTIHKPLLLGNNVQLQENTEIGPGAIIGSNVIVDSGTRISNSIILDNSYVGAELTIEDKILHNNMAIAADTGTVVHFVDDHLLSGIANVQGRGLPVVVVHWCLAALFYGTALLPALFFRFLLQGSDGRQQTETILRRNGDSLVRKTVLLSDKNLLGQLARRLVLDKILQLPLVLTGKIDLVGNKPFPATPEGAGLYEDFVNYLPGVFYFSEAENIQPGDFQEEITERFFSANRSLAGDLKVIFKTIINRW